MSSSIRRIGFFSAAFSFAWLILVGAVAVTVAAQEQKKPPVEEEEPVKPSKPKKKVHVEEEEPNRKTGQNEPPRLAELALEAEQAASPVLRDLFRDLATPYDLVTWNDQRRNKVAPVSDYVGPKPDKSAVGSMRVNLQIYDDKGQARVMMQFSLREVDHIDHYEDIALGRVQKFLDDPAGDSAKPLAPSEKMAAAEKVLAAVFRFHESARGNGPREGRSWTALRDRLRKKLQEVQFERLQMMVDPGEWAQALEYASRLARSYPEPEIQRKLVASLGRLVQQSMQKQDYGEARQRFEALERQFHNNPAMDEINKLLESRAEELVAEARSKENSNDRGRALELVKTAEILSRNLPGLQDYMDKLRNVLPPTLEVGVRDLPEKLSPAAAVTDSEKQAVELLFESLVKPVDVEGIGQEYVPGLARGMPQVVPLARKFQLLSNAFWSDSDGDKQNKVGSVDVAFTIKTLHASAPQWTELIDAVPPTDAGQITIKLHQGYLEPLSLMSFKILPEHANMQKFDEQPIGSGPFRLQGRDGQAVDFAANPAYRRNDKLGQPQIRKVRFFQSANPSQDFNGGRLHVLLDVPIEGIQPLLSLKSVEVKKMRNRRIYFLAVNHGVPALGLEPGQTVRRAIAHAIDRTQILDDVFRGFLKGTPDAPHRPLNGPYPPDSWACNPSIQRDPHDRLLVKPLADQINGRLKRSGALHLKYPANDDKALQACQAIRAQVKDATGIDLQLVPRSPHELHDDVERAHDYELAYYHLDYPDNVFWLWPLFNPNGAEKGSNYLGYIQDNELVVAFQEAMAHRNFADVKKHTHNIHRILYNKMPLIPLWQLDTYVAFHKDVAYAPRLDPLRLFSDIEEWKLRRPDTAP
jgi:ABC-type oligopeptide transport system substrate-binding subunit